MSNNNDSGRIAHAHSPSYGINIVVWLVLIALTTITVAIAGIDLGSLTLGVALLIAAVKSWFVINSFMHIKYEDAFLKVLIGIVLVILIIFLSITATDIFYR